MDVEFDQCYRISDQSGKELTKLRVTQHTYREGGRYISGRIDIALKWPSPTPWNGGTFGTATHGGDWSPYSYRAGHYLHVVHDFYLPEHLRGHGIGTTCWSLVYRSLPEQVRGVLHLKGGLSRKDGTPENLERRNAFWKRMLAAGSRLESDNDGEGGFLGLFVDPDPGDNFAPALCVQMIEPSAW